VKRATFLDVAADAGVSRATVSLVMRNSPTIPEETRERVLRSAEKLGYVYDRVAASLRSQKSGGAVGIVITNVGNPFFAEITTGVESVLSDTGRLVIFGQHSENLATQERLLNQLLEFRVQGVILTPVKGTPVSTIKRLTANGVAVVLCVRRLNHSGAGYVGADNVAGAYLAAAHLLDNHLARLAFVGGGEGSPRSERSQGIRTAIDERGGDLSKFVSISSPTTREGGYEATNELLRTVALPVGIFAYNDIVAFGVAAAVRDAGLIVGRDVSLIGFDDIQASRFEQPPLTTVAIDPVGIGRRAAEALMRASAAPGEPVEEITPVHLVVRRSCGCGREGD
jgi:LacI family transcriptional regulator